MFTQKRTTPYQNKRVAVLPTQINSMYSNEMSSLNIVDYISGILEFDRVRDLFTSEFIHLNTQYMGTYETEYEIDENHYKLDTHNDSIIEIVLNITGKTHCGYCSEQDEPAETWPTTNRNEVWHIALPSHLSKQAKTVTPSMFAKDIQGLSGYCMCEVCERRIIEINVIQ